MMKTILTLNNVLCWGPINVWSHLPHSLVNTTCFCHCTCYNALKVTTQTFCQFKFFYQVHLLRNFGSPNLYRWSLSSAKFSYSIFKIYKMSHFVEELEVAAVCNIMTVAVLLSYLDMYRARGPVVFTIVTTCADSMTVGLPWNKHTHENGNMTRLKTTSLNWNSLKNGGKQFGH